jgi:hypothetical protein
LKIPSALLEEAAKIYLVANTPAFLTSRLARLSGVAAIAREQEEDSILSQIQTLLKSRPETLEELVQPFLWVISLATLDNRSVLQRLTTVSAPHHRWFSEVVDIMLTRIRPTTMTILRADKPTLTAPRSKTVSASRVLITSIQNDGTHA